MTLQQLLAIDLPILQAPMAGVQGSAMAVAVSNAGGLGSLPCAMLSPDAMRKELATIQAQTDKPLNVNFFCHTPVAADAEREAGWRATLAPYYNEYGIDSRTIPKGPGRTPFSSEAAELISEFKPAVVSFHFGLPTADLLARVKSWGAKVLSSATTVAEARWLEKHGADMIIAQGVEAGGHRGMFLSEELTTQVGTLALLPQIVRAVNLPVIAAGGIADGRGVAAAMMLGASAAQLGTAYLFCSEAKTSAVHRSALKTARDDETTLTNIFTGRPARAVVNKVIRDIGALNRAAPEFPLASNTIAPLRAKAEATGNGAYSSLWSGQAVTLCRERPAAELTRALAADALRLLGR